MAPGTGVKRGQYSLLEDKEINSIPASRHRNILAGSSRLSKSSLITVLILSLSTITGIGGYLFGRRFEPRKSEGLFQLNRVPVTFEYDQRFVEAPSNVTDALWDSLFPDNGGFFGHPSLEQTPVEFAVYHQLHCLYGLRNAFWAMRNGMQSGEGQSHSGEHSENHYSHAGGVSDSHMGHCLDYIRQSLMCVADTTIEVAVKAPGGRAGVRGWGTQHMCGDYQQLGEWTSQWQYFQ
ncbi:hypothetical protein BP6252_13657 [Coleophoma cylindrospora]|uniref:Oxidase ustYa n=1 Tax=Coleophoma cylindrospora TaxID=1849047 RepID=A0A3D8Q8U4_9HELO|nr:hypothetical protein BP6252_13657 [Coleophoma cylindrospora]